MNHLLAQNLVLPGNSSPVTGPLKASNFIDVGRITLGSILVSLMKYVFPIAGVCLLIVILMAGFTLLTSAGDTKKMEKGKQTLTYGIVGFLIIFLAYWITQLMGIMFGITAITDTFK